jgi:hypothetical protein
VRQESRAELIKKYKKVTAEEAEDSWSTQYNASEKVIRRKSSYLVNTVLVSLKEIGKVDMFIYLSSLWLIKIIGRLSF